MGELFALLPKTNSSTCTLDPLAPLPSRCPPSCITDFSHFAGSFLWPGKQVRSAPTFINHYSRPPVSVGSLPMGQVTCSQLQLENMKWEISEINHSSVFNCMAFWHAWWKRVQSHSVLGMWVITPSSVSRCKCNVFVSHLVTISITRSTAMVSQGSSTLILLNNGPKA